MDEWVSRGAKASVLLVIGTPGCGASSSLEKILRDADIESVWFGSGSPKLRAHLGDAACSCYSATGRRKMVVVDGFDACMADANAAADLGAFIKKKLPCPTIFLAHRTRTIAKRFRDLFTVASYAARAAVVELQGPSTEQLTALLGGGTRAAAIAARARGDVRAARAAMDWSGDVSALKDDVPETFEAVDRALDGVYETVREVLDVTSCDSTVISYGIFERYGLSPDIADYFSAADVLESAMFKSQRWDLFDVYTALGVAGPALLPKKPLPKATKFTYGTVWSKMHLQASREKYVRKLSNRHIPVTELGVLRNMILQAEASKDYDTLKRLLHGWSPDELLGLMRLWKCKYTQTTHARIIKRAGLRENI